MLSYPGVAAGETAIESLLSTNPDPDHVTHAHAREGPATGADADNSSTPSIDSDKENNIEMVNLLHHPNTPGGVATPTQGGVKQQRDDSFVDIVDEDVKPSEQPGLEVDQKPSVKVCRSCSILACGIVAQSGWCCVQASCSKHAYSRAAEAKDVCCIVSEHIKAMFTSIFGTIATFTLSLVHTQPALNNCFNASCHKQTAMASTVCAVWLGARGFMILCRSFVSRVVLCHDHEL